MSSQKGGVKAVEICSQAFMEKIWFFDLPLSCRLVDRFVLREILARRGWKISSRRTSKRGRTQSSSDDRSCHRDSKIRKKVFIFQLLNWFLGAWVLLNIVMHVVAWLMIWSMTMRWWSMLNSWSFMLCTAYQSLESRSGAALTNVARNKGRWCQRFVATRGLQSPKKKNGCLRTFVTWL